MAIGKCIPRVGDCLYANAPHTRFLSGAWQSPCAVRSQEQKIRRHQGNAVGIILLRRVRDLYRCRIAQEAAVERHTRQRVLRLDHDSIPWAYATRAVLVNEERPERRKLAHKPGGRLGERRLRWCRLRL